MMCIDEVGTHVLKSRQAEVGAFPATVSWRLHFPFPLHLLTDKWQFCHLRGSLSSTGTRSREGETCHEAEIRCLLGSGHSWPLCTVLMPPLLAEQNHCIHCVQQMAENWRQEPSQKGIKTTLTSRTTAVPGRNPS